MTKAGVARLLVAGLGVAGLSAGTYLARADVQLSGLGAAMMCVLDWFGGTPNRQYYLKPAQRPQTLSSAAARRTYVIAIVIIVTSALFSLGIAVGLVPVPIPVAVAWWSTATASSSLVLLVFPRTSVAQQIADHNTWLARMTPRFEEPTLG